MKYVPVVTKEEARSLVRTAIGGADSSLVPGRIAILDEEPRELWWAWIVPVQSADYVVSRDPQHLLFSLGPYLVDKFTREVIPTGTGSRLHALERARGYRSWWNFWGPNAIMNL